MRSEFFNASAKQFEIKEQLLLNCWEEMQMTTLRPAEDIFTDFNQTFSFILFPHTAYQQDAD